MSSGNHIKLIMKDYIMRQTQFLIKPMFDACFF